MSTLSLGKILLIQPNLSGLFLNTSYMNWTAVSRMFFLTSSNQFCWLCIVSPPVTLANSTPGNCYSSPGLFYCLCLWPDGSSGKSSPTPHISVEMRTKAGVPHREKAGLQLSANLKILNEFHIRGKTDWKQWGTLYIEGFIVLCILSIRIISQRCYPLAVGRNIHWIS